MHPARVSKRGAIGLAARGGISDRIIQGEERWKPNAYKGYRRCVVKCWIRVSRKLVEVSLGKDGKLGKQRTAEVSK